MIQTIIHFKFRLGGLFCLSLLLLASLPTLAAANSIDSINVVGNGDAVMIETSEPVKYTVFKLIDPPRLIVDIPGVDADKVKTPLKVNNSFINVISASAYKVGEKNIGRVEIGLNSTKVEHEVKSGENSILVSLSGGSGAKAIMSAQTNVTSKPKAAAPKAKSNAATATRVTAINSSTSGNKTLVNIETNGSVGNFNVFGYDEQGSVVLDVWGVRSSIEEYLLQLDSPYVKTVRVGEHPDKVRLVFNSRTGKTPSFKAEKSGNKILLTLGEPSAQKRTSAGTWGGSGLRVEAVDFTKSQSSSKLTIRNSARAQYKATKSEDGKAIIIDISGAIIDGALVRTVDATGLGTPVDTISSYQLTTSPKKKVRILVRLAEDVAYKVTEDGSSINIDFPATTTTARAGTGEEIFDEEDDEFSEAMQLVTKRKRYTGSRIDLDMVDSDIRDILKLLAEVSDLNIIAADDVKGKVTMRLKDVPWDQAFDLVLMSKDLDKVRIGNVIRVAPAARLRKEREAVLVAIKAKEKLEPLKLRYIQVNYEEATNLVAHVAEVLSDRGSVTSHEATNTLIVKDVSEKIAAAEDVVLNLDKIIPQVLIEARIVEATSSFARDLGIQWGVDYSAALSDNHFNLFGSHEESYGQTAYDPGTQDAIAEGGGSYPVEKSDWPAKAGVTNYAVNLPATGSVGPLGALGFIFGTAGANPLILDLRLSAGEQAGLLKTISRPRITTLNNKEAKIEQGESIPFQTTSASGTETKFIDANLSLTVTPQITPDGSVLMEIKASRNSVGTFRSSSGEPSINKKEAQTEVLVKDGETTVIGGIVISDTREGDSGIPFLRDIPILGWIFKNETISDSQTELLIFITPTIIRNDVSMG